MTYKEVSDYIAEKEKLGSVFGLESIRELLRRLGNPEKGIPAIHIAGTNGKGSILSYVEETLIEAGLSVGRYISPTIFDYRERWRLNKEWATEEDVSFVITEVAEKVLEMTDEGMDSPTAFEIETAATFLLFKRWNVDVMLIECGMGGLLDATNVIEGDVINVIASISMDHMQILGATISEIAKQKLGIVRKGSVLVSYPQVDEACDVIREYARENDVRLTEVNVESLSIVEDDAYGSSFIYKGNDYQLQIGGSHQILNAVTAIDTLFSFYDEFLGDNEALNIDRLHFAEYIKRGLRKTKWEGRFSVYKKNPVIVVDGAHNEDAWLKLRESLEKYFTNDVFIYIIGVLRDKEYKRMVEILAPTADYVICVESDNPRALDCDELAREFTSAGVHAESCKTSYEAALERAIDMAKKRKKELVICGTLSITGKMIRCIESIK